MMTPNNLVSALRRLRVETGSIACLGCGHEHGCSVHGCAIIREAADLIEAIVVMMDDAPYHVKTEARLMCLDTLGYSAKDIEVITPEQYEAEFGGDEDG